MIIIRPNIRLLSQSVAIGFATLFIKLVFRIPKLSSLADERKPKEILKIGLFFFFKNSKRQKFHSLILWNFWFFGTWFDYRLFLNNGRNSKLHAHTLIRREHLCVGAFFKKKKKRFHLILLFFFNSDVSVISCHNSFLCNYA